MRLRSFFVLFVFVFIGSVIFTDAQTVEKYVVIVKVKAPPIATSAYLKEGFLKAVPTYQKIDGLQFKAFSIINVDGGNHFGGIYLWENKEKAERWYSPQWISSVKTRYGVEPIVEYYSVAVDKFQRSVGYDQTFDESVSIFIHDLAKKDLKKFTSERKGLLRSYFVKTGEKFGAIMLFADKESADNFTDKQKIVNREWFETPVLLNNLR
jgi:hypothetical protein